MKLLSLQNNKVTISPEGLMLSPFKKIWEGDKSKNKVNALEDLSYVYYFADFSSVYASLDEEARKEALTTDIYDDKRKPSILVEKAIEFYKDKQDVMSPSLSFLESANHAANKIKEYFYSVDFTKTDKMGKMLYDAKKVNEMLTAVGKTLEGIDKIRERVKRELQDDSKIRGGVEKSYFEDIEDE